MRYQSKQTNTSCGSKMKKYMVGDEIHNKAFKHLLHDLGINLM